MCLPNGLNLFINLQTYTIGAYTKLPYSIHDMVTPQFQPEILHALISFNLGYHTYIYIYVIQGFPARRSAYLQFFHRHSLPPGLTAIASHLVPSLENSVCRLLTLLIGALPSIYRVTIHFAVRATSPFIYPDYPVTNKGFKNASLIDRKAMRTTI
jgi:hypothetical protein